MILTLGRHPQKLWNNHQRALSYGFESVLVETCWRHRSLCDLSRANPYPHYCWQIIALMRLSSSVSWIPRQAIGLWNMHICDISQLWVMVLKASNWLFHHSDAMSLNYILFWWYNIPELYNNATSIPSNFFYHCIPPSTRPGGQGQFKTFPKKSSVLGNWDLPYRFSQKHYWIPIQVLHCHFNLTLLWLIKTPFLFLDYLGVVIFFQKYVS